MTARAVTEVVHLLNNPFVTWTAGIVLGSWLTSLTRDARAWRHKVRAKRWPRIRIRQDGWVVHKSGPFPFAGRCLVQVQFADGSRASGHALDLRAPNEWPNAWWRGAALQRRWNITAFRIVECRP